MDARDAKMIATSVARAAALVDARKDPALLRVEDLAYLASMEDR